MSGDGGAPMTTREQGLRYLIVGGCNFVFGFSVFLVLQLVLEGHVHYLIVFCLAWLINVTEAFATNRLFVFQVRGHLLRDFGRFCTVQLSGAGVNIVGLAAAVDGLGLNVLVAQAILLPCFVVVTFLGHRLFSFNRPD